MSQPEIGPDGKKVIQTLPPLPERASALDLSAATGQPRRAPWMLVAIAFLYGSSVWATVVFARFWWRAIHITEFHASARLLGWTDPRVGSWQSMVWVCLLALAAMAMITAPAVAAFQAWNGHRWSRTAGIVAVVITLLAVLFTPPALATVALAALGTLILWTPPVTRYFEDWQRFRAEPPREPRQFDHVQYGPLDRYVPRDEPALTAATLRRER